MTQTEEPTGQAVAIRTPTDNEIEEFRRRGAAEVVLRRDMEKLRKQLRGLTWGSGYSIVKGSDFSEMQLAVFAEYCALTGANPLTHVDFVGDGPYLNADYWSDKLNSDPYFIDYSQRDLSPAMEAALRERAESHRSAAAELRQAKQVDEANERIRRALDVEDEAEDLRLARIGWKAAEWASDVVETTIRKFATFAPIEKIRSGEITDFSIYIVEVKECNWAGNRPRGTKKNGETFEADPIGNAEPSKTARTRSLRRCSTKGFSATFAKHDEQIRKAEEALEAEWAEIRSQRSELASTGPTRSITAGAGEPTRGNGNGREIRVESLEGDETAEDTSEAVDRPESEESAASSPESQPEPEPEPAAEPEKDAEPFDRIDAQAAFFATLKDAGVKDRRVWMAENDFPSSVRQFTEADFRRARGILFAPVLADYLDGCLAVDFDAEEFAFAAFGKPIEKLFLREVRDLVGRLADVASGLDKPAE